jgi:DNA-binding protein YbaB
MNIGFYYQLLAGLTREGSRFSYPRALKDIVRTGDLDDVRQLEELLANEIANCSLHDNNGAEYFAFLSESALLFAMSRSNFTEFERLYEVVEKRLQGLRSSGQSQIDTAGWLWYFNYLKGCADRLMRKGTIETLERNIDDIEWDEIGSEFIYRVSAINGYVYLNESNPDKVNKARFWLQKAITEQEISRTLVAFLNLADFYLNDTKGENQKRLQDHIQKLEQHANSASDAGLVRVYRTAVLDYQARALVARSAGHDDDIVKVEENLRNVREVEKNVTYDGKNMPGFVKAYLKALFSSYYFNISSSELDQEDIEDLLAMAMDDINEALSIARRMKDESMKTLLRLDWMVIAAKKQTKVNEKDLKEILNDAKKGDDHRVYVRAAIAYADFYIQRKEAQKAYELLVDMVKKGYKKIDEGGFYLVCHGLSKINDIFNVEVDRPGVSWMVNALTDFFNSLAEMMDSLEGHLAAIGQEMFDKFLEQMLRMEPATHFNLKVYLKYQFYEMKLLRLTAIARGDALGQQIAEKLLGEISHENSPLNFVQANWEEFKDVPNSVRNKVLNKCISISKGDLPLAADHIDFSYRNLRSYITFKEVNRLGFFLDKQETNNRQLENGIRLMFFDLYKRGTIFEVVFDMPKFLVEHSKGGFSSQDLEEALDIKGTTAKKYIKIMIDIGIIRLERSVGRKHFYKLRKDNVMNRLGKEASVVS